MKINWTVRINNPMWWVQIALAILTPIFTYAGITAEEITSWAVLGDLLLGAISNPYVLALVGVSVYNAIVDPTTKGVGDSKLALSYTTPAKDKDDTTEEPDTKG